MNTTHDLSPLSDDELIVGVTEVLKQSRRVEAVLVEHIAEVDSRRLFAREALPSMFRFCTDVLHLSEAEAYRRITAGRLSRKFPLLLTMLEDGRLHLCGIGVLSKHLTDANHEELLAKAAHKTKRKIEELVAELAPKPDVPPSIRKRPERKVKPEASSGSSVNGSTQAIHPTSSKHPEKAEPIEQRSAPKTLATPEKRPTIEPLSQARFKVEFTASAMLRDKLKRLESLIAGSDIATIIDVAVSEKLERLEAKRFGKTNRPRKNIEDADTSPGKRGISAPVRRAVWIRDGGQCTYRTRDGRRCPERHRLEYHHDDPHGFGGDRSVANIRLLCTAHNLYMAELDFGKENIDAYRGSADRVGEPQPSFELCPGTATGPVPYAQLEPSDRLHRPGESVVCGEQTVVAGVAWSYVSPGSGDPRDAPW